MPAPVNRNPTQKTLIVSAVKSRQGIVLKEASRTSDLPSHAETEQINNPATVSTQLTITKNMGNFESLKVGVIVSSPCRNDDDQKLAVHEHDMGLAMKMLEKEAALVSVEWFD